MDSRETMLNGDASRSTGNLRRDSKDTNNTEVNNIATTTAKTIKHHNNRNCKASIRNRGHHYRRGMSNRSSASGRSMSNRSSIESPEPLEDEEALPPLLKHAPSSLSLVSSSPSSSSSSGNLRNYDGDEDGDDESVASIRKTLLENNITFCDHWYQSFTLLYFVITIAVTILVYVTLRREESNDFKIAYGQDVLSVTNTIQLRWNNIIEATNNLADTISAITSSDSKSVPIHSDYYDYYYYDEKANNNNHSSSLLPSTLWPFITIPHFEVYASHARKQILQSDFIALAPIIPSSSMKDRWEIYALKNKQDWMKNIEIVQQTQTQQQAFQKRNTDDSNDDKVDNVQSHIYRLEGDDLLTMIKEDGPGPYAPLWQRSPPPPFESLSSSVSSSRLPSRVNYNILSHPVIGRLIMAYLEGTSTTKEKIFISEIMNLNWLYSIDNQNDEYKINNENEMPVHDTNIDNDNNNYILSRSLMLRPIVIPSTGGSSNNQEDHIRMQNKIIGILQIAMNWESFLINILPEDRPGLIIVLTNSCGQTYTYRLKGGDQVIPLGEGDHHLSIYDKFEEIVTLNGSDDTIKDSNNNIIDDSLQQQPSEACIYEFHIYPSMELYNQNLVFHKHYQIYTGVIGFIFVLIGLIFIVYQRNVRIRVKKIVDQAAQSHAVVSSLFPATVRERLFGESSYAGNSNNSIIVGGGTEASGVSGDLIGRSGRAGAEATELSNATDHLPSSRRESMYRMVPGLASLPNHFGAGTSPHHGIFNYGLSGLLKDNNEHNRRNSGSTASKTSRGAGGGSGGSGDRLPRRDNSKPIADLFPNATVLFADICGFTAWASVREPTQVFTLLETLYHAFDHIAKRRRVFKVETIGDCYVAATGLPAPQNDHALVMTRFARDCMYKVSELTKKLEVTLGPDTGDLRMRFGIHSGPVTAGVLRGDRSRFQLFGDTVNTASRMESTGKGNRIHISQETANQLIASGKGHWVEMREEKVTVKGKGLMQTYWLNPEGYGTSSCQSLANGELGVDSGNESESIQSLGESDGDGDGEGKKLSSRARSFSEDDMMVKNSEDKLSRLISWNVDVLSRLLKKIIVRRKAVMDSTDKTKNDIPATENKEENSKQKLHEVNGTSLGADGAPLADSNFTTVLEEVKEIITLPKFDAGVAVRQEDPDLIELSYDVNEQLRDYIITIASYYHDNPFHNFEHASHVSMSIVKLLSRIVDPYCIEKNSQDETKQKNSDGKKKKKKSKTTHMDKNMEIASQMHVNTYGITSDPLTQFAVVFSGLIHDVDHPGVPNAQLIKENVRIAALYKNKSLAEQNSVDIAWSLLLEPEYEDLRNVIYCNETEHKHFRQLVVNCVMATDIVDKELKELRNARWDKAFQTSSAKDSTTSPESSDTCDGHGEGEEKVEESTVADDTDDEDDDDESINRKATIVIEHIIQASDVAHTMQHWHIYRKWNERLFQEVYKAYKGGRSDRDPTEYWYKGEIAFFDFYIIPLAKKLAECGVFGVSSDEYLNYAEQNRFEWEQRGEEVLEDMAQTARELFRDRPRVRRRKSIGI